MLVRMDATGVIDVAGLHRHYRGGGRGFDAVRGVSFSVRRGELFALLGTNGAGKTSLLEVAEGLAPATSGTVRVLGLDPTLRAPCGATTSRDRVAGQRVSA
jgi:ABC-2 type transport system ATP-binding protein